MAWTWNSELGMDMLIYYWDEMYTVYGKQPFFVSIMQSLHEAIYNIMAVLCVEIKVSAM